LNKFEKVSFKEFCKGSKIDQFEKNEEGKIKIINGHLIENKESLRLYENIVMPRRKTIDSAGYDIHSPISFVLHPDETIKIATGLKIYLDKGLWLMGIPRSSLGFGFYMQLNNTVMAVDGDYVDNPNNEGHIFVKITNCGDETLKIKEGDGFIQTIIVPFYLTIDDKPGDERIGGIGSTNR